VIEYLSAPPTSDLQTVVASDMSRNMKVEINKLNRINPGCPRHPGLAAMKMAYLTLRAAIDEAGGNPVNILDEALKMGVTAGENEKVVWNSETRAEEARRDAALKDALQKVVSLTRAAHDAHNASRGAAAWCLLQIAQSVPEVAQPHPFTKELIAAVEEGRSMDAAALRMKATSVLQGLDRCLYKIHPGRTGLQLAAWAVSATLPKVDKDALVVRAVEYAHTHGIDVTGPLVEYILRRKY
jgi:hypothetical protein